MRGASLLSVLFLGTVAACAPRAAAPESPAAAGAPTAYRVEVVNNSGEELDVFYYEGQAATLVGTFAANATRTEVIPSGTRPARLDARPSDGVSARGVECRMGAWSEDGVVRLLCAPQR